MARRKSSRVRNALLPEVMILQIRRRLRQIVGLLMGGFALTLAAILISYSPHDPSLNAATIFPAGNLLHFPGAIVADFLIQLFGLTPILLVVAFAVWGGFFITETKIKHFGLRIIALCCAVFVFSVFLGLFANKTNYLITPTLGGVSGVLLMAALTRLLKATPTLVSLSCLVVSGVCYFYSLGIRPAQWNVFLQGLFKALIGLVYLVIYPVVALLKKLISRDRQGTRERATKQGLSPAQRQAQTTRGTSQPEIHESYQAFCAPNYQETASETDEGVFADTHVQESRTSSIKVKQTLKQPSTATSTAFSYPKETDEDYQLPPLDFLQAPLKKGSNILMPEALQQVAQHLEQVLQEFGIRGEIVAVCPGPVVTLYELKPAPGIKTSRVIGLADDIARSMSAHAARIAVIPGRNVIGIELPNKSRETVYLRELLQSESYAQFPSPLALVLGKDIGGNPVVADLARMPHLLVAGTTGSGKSVSINTMILSLLFRLPPDKCKFIMIDPKMLELSVYDGIPHLLSPVVTDPKKAVVALKWAVREMENRYRAMAKLGVRNIDGYNARIEEARLSGELLMRRVQTGFDPDTGKPIFENQSLAVEPLPYIVVIVDEMADLMLVAGKEIEAGVQRLAQMARAAGIHLIMATQRPSVDVITGTIKANFPTRISFQVTSKIDSRTILGEQGAEQLLGQGDMLYMMGGGRLSRVHGPFVRDEEVEKIVHFLKMQGEPTYIEGITEDDEELAFGDSEDGSRSGGDILYQQAIEVIRREGKVSTSFIQRHLQIGYNRAARIIDQMEKEGIISPANHAGKREIL